MAGHTPAKVLARNYSQEEVQQAIRDYGRDLEDEQLREWLERLRGTVVGAEEALDHFHALFDRAWYAERALERVASAGDDAKITLQGTGRLRGRPPIPFPPGRPTD